jgi:hypothetical protein
MPITPYFTFAFVLLATLLASTITHAQQGNLPKPVQKLPAYPVVCVTPNWTTEPCENRTLTPYGPQNEPSGWQCENVRVTEIFDSTVRSMEFLVTGTERRDNSFKLEGFDKLYLNGKLCTRFKPEDIRFSIPLVPAPVKCLKPDGTEELCESRHRHAQSNPEPRRTTTVLYHEPGGIFEDDLKRWQALAQTGDDVEIRGPCISGCTIIMAYIPNDRLCFGEQASLKFHLARDKQTGEASIFNQSVDAQSLPARHPPLAQS